ADLRTGISCVGNLSGVQQRLGGDAAGVQARAANLVGLDKGHTHTQLRTPKGRSVPTATGTQDDEIVGLTHTRSSIVGHDLFERGSMWGIQLANASAADRFRRHRLPWRLPSILAPRALKPHPIAPCASVG